MTLAEWKEQLLEIQGYPKDESRIGRPFIIKTTHTDIHLYGGESPGAATLLLREGALAFEWHGYMWGCLSGDERAFAVPPALYTRGIRPSLVGPYNGQIDWSQEISSIEIISASGRA